MWLEGNREQKNTAELQLSLAHLQTELARIDLRIRRAVFCWQLAGEDPTDAFRGLYVSDEKAIDLMSRPLCANWTDITHLTPEQEAAFAEAEALAEQEAQAAAEAAHTLGITPRLEQLATTFGLDPFEVDVLLLCLAPSLDLRYERLFGYLHDNLDLNRPTVSLALDLLCEGASERLLAQGYFTDGASLFGNQLLDRFNQTRLVDPPLLCQSLEVDQTILAWLLGRYRPGSELGRRAEFSYPQENEADRLLAANVLSELDQAANGGPILVFYGPDRLGQEAAVRLLASRRQKPLLTVDLADSVANEVSPLYVLKLVLRDTHLTSALPCLTGWDACLIDGAPPTDFLAELCDYPDLIIVAGESPWRATGIRRERRLAWLAFPVPEYTRRHDLWQFFLGIDRQESSFNLTDLAGQFQLTAGQIRDAVTTARDAAAQYNKRLQNQDLFTAARSHSNPNLARLARRIKPRYDWEDIVLPDDQLALLREIVHTVRGRPQVLDDWGLGQKLVSSRGVTVLFAGPPGTGKTMAAEIIANEIGLDLYKIDLSTVVSKYIGETEKNLERIFSEAESSNAILFFDEADALFGKRSEVRDSHDRYANIEISYLLQRMEAYDGVTILATNLRANLDEAFTRRLQFAVDFPFPEKEDRRQIWKILFPTDVPRQQNLDFDILAERYRLTGGNIRNILVSAAYLAASDGQCVTMNHLIYSTRRELQKMGRLVREEDLR